MKIYLVGGAVRDKLLGYPFSERDWVVVGATPEQLLNQGFQPVGKDFPVFLHPDTKEEYALARTERKSGKGYTGFSCYSSPDVTLEEDLIRRDLTINAMAEDPQGNIIDPYNGRDDLENKLLRHVSPAFTEDPLRVIRIARFCARYAHLGFTVANDTLQLMNTITRGGELQTIAAERIWRELERAIMEQSPQQFFNTLSACHALKELMPELAPFAATSSTALCAAATASESAVVRFAVLFARLDKAAAEKLCTRIKAPNEFSAMAILVSQYAEVCSRALPNAESILTLLEQLDCLRRPQRLLDFTACCKHLFPNSPATEQLIQACERCKQVDVTEIIAAGFSGPEIATQLRIKRLQQLDRK